MSYTDDAVRAKLSALNETQESIVTVAQWIMFHRRHAERTAQLWMQRLKDSGVSKRLNLIYLANEVVQQSKARKKDDFLTAFSPMIADATGWAYKGSTTEVQQKLRRVIEVWRVRQIFEQSVQEALEARVDDLDQSRSSSKKPLLGGALYSSSNGVPTELEPLAFLQYALSKAEAALKPAISVANTEHYNLHDSSQPPPSSPVYAAGLSSIVKSLAKAENAVTESIKTRVELIQALESLIQTNKATLDAESAQITELHARRAEMEAKKREVEDSIMRGLSDGETFAPVAADNENTTVAGGAALHSMSASPPEDDYVIPRPEVEALTPPPFESFTPPMEPMVSNLPVFTPTPDADVPLDPRLAHRIIHPPSAGTADMAMGQQTMSGYHARPDSSGGLTNEGPASVKRRKMSRGDEEFAGFGNMENAMEGLDDEVVGMLS